jgi:hypothetical protein
MSFQFRLESYFLTKYKTTEMPYLAHCDDQIHKTYCPSENICQFRDKRALFIR